MIAQSPNTQKPNPTTYDMSEKIAKNLKICEKLKKLKRNKFEIKSWKHQYLILKKFQNMLLKILTSMVLIPY